jgi:hypothetical protein
MNGSSIWKGVGFGKEVWRPNDSLKATWDAPRFAIDGSILLSWNARVEECPGALAHSRYAPEY